MPISEDRFLLALERLEAEDWARFEKLASIFLASEFGALRTMASASGDGGRDAILFASDDEPKTVFQYSVTPKWQAKIRATIRRLKEVKSDVSLLIYVSNMKIGALADNLKKELRKEGMHLDIRDARFFVERANVDMARMNAAEELALAKVNPLLEKRGVIAASGVMGRDEANTALMYIEMQQQDEVAGKGLTRSCFEALVKAALHGSSNDNRVPRSEIYRRINAYLPQHSQPALARFIDAALHRLKRHAISMWNGKAEDEFHINYQETQKLQEASARLIRMRHAFDKDVKEIINLSNSFPDADEAQIVEAVHKIVQLYFLQRGEGFASAVARGNFSTPNNQSLKSFVQQHFPIKLIKGRDAIGFALSCIDTLLTIPAEDTKSYLTLLSDSYTLMSFLSATPDVQAATNKLFNQTIIWVDTGVILPVIAETIEKSNDKPITNLFAQARAAGAKLHVTRGVVEEIERHLNLCRTYAAKNYNTWEGSVPYVYARYVFAGGAEAFFSSWIENFMGMNDPVGDLSEYLHEELGIIIDSAHQHLDFKENFHNEVLLYWMRVHEQRRNSVGKYYNMNTDRLARHDAENCITVINERKATARADKIGHASWWLTLDRAASRMQNAPELVEYQSQLSSVVMSIDFLMRYVAFGPGRNNAQSLEKSQSRVFATPLMEVVPPSLIQAALAIRATHALEPERMIRRRLRDALDLERSKTGPLQEAGLDGLREALLAGY